MTGEEVVVQKAPFEIAGCFATYLRRLMDDPQGRRTCVLSGMAEKLPEQAEAALVVGERNSLWFWRAKRRGGLARQFSGSSYLDFGSSQEVPVAIIDRWDLKSLPSAPERYDVLAVVTTYNEADIIGQLIERLASDEIRVHVIDNWSTDATLDVVRECARGKDVTFERFPQDGPSGYFELEILLTRVEQVAQESGADWIVHHDADEIREPPWRGLSLRQGLWAVDQFGFNCIDHTIVNFRPIVDAWKPGDDLASSFDRFEFGEAPAHFLQLKAWKPQDEPVLMARSGGHEAVFAARRVFPYKFLTRHYPIRSQEQGERKILRERQQRWSPEERARGWHAHYDHYDDSSSFSWDPSGLVRWADMDNCYLLQRLSGVGLPGNPFPGE